jgi:3-oxoacyl-[acyl-carrier protein] reductase
MADRLKGKVCLVTGATSGIGEATAKAFAREGAKVAFVGRRAEKGQKVEAEIRAEGGDATFVQGDLSKPEDCENIVKKTVEIYGTIDVLMNNAGMGTVTPFEAYDMKKDYDDVMMLNLKAYFLTCKAALPYMVEKGKGNIVNVASLGAYTGMPFQASYAASKGGVVQFTKTLAVEYSKKGIRANTISPGLTLTEMVEEGTEVEALLRSIVPGGNAGTADGVANAAVFCASDEVPFMSGANIMIDGATSCGPCLPVY